jgi:hypothetical protein
MTLLQDPASSDVSRHPLSDHLVEGVYAVVLVVTVTAWGVVGLVSSWGLPGSRSRDIRSIDDDWPDLIARARRCAHLPT